ncbi:hypothetical protein DSL64_25660 [Dyadobacter luteus]|uniref:Uncharacterized protein n=1 Tax=Dyadobacter luteus TaxID=2259619 RepID=A0A3D8Y426_9BACT|nr:hypothetical protein DSL64_25660 [Dyadobacter luteus]
MKHLKFSNFAIHSLKFFLIFVTGSFFSKVIYDWIKGNPFEVLYAHWLTNALGMSKMIGYTTGSILYGLLMARRDARKSQ